MQRMFILVLNVNHKQFNKRCYKIILIVIYISGKIVKTCFDLGDCLGMGMDTRVIDYPGLLGVWSHDQYNRDNGQLEMIIMMV